MGAILSISLSAFSLSLLATIFVWAGQHKTAVIAATGPFLDAARYATASAIHKVPEYRFKWRAPLLFPLRGARCDGRGPRRSTDR